MIQELIACLAFALVVVVIAAWMVIGLAMLEALP